MQEEFGPGDGPAEWLSVKAQDRLADSSSAFVPVFAVETK
jgi:hypothetical protein